MRSAADRMWVAGSIVKIVLRYQESLVQEGRGSLSNGALEPQEQ
ncbi:hypothetical protein VDGL01_05036 [Verticillium dahliae]